MTAKFWKPEPGKTYKVKLLCNQCRAALSGDTGYCSDECKDAGEVLDALALRPNGNDALAGYWDVIRARAKVILGEESTP